MESKIILEPCPCGGKCGEISDLEGTFICMCGPKCECLPFCDPEAYERLLEFWK
jgi:hypothetical protein